MSRHLEILYRTGLDGELFGTPVRPAKLVGKGHARDQWQQLVHQLFLSPASRDRVSIALAAATPGEGTSYVASHLAAELARSTRLPSLLLEANLYRPAQAQRHGIEADPGLRQTLTDKDFLLERSLRPSALEHLWVMPAGSPTGATAEAPDWTRFPRIFQVLRDRFPGIVVDLPPVNLSTDALILAHEFDGIVLVVQADLCSREVIRNALERLQRANTNVLGTVLNKRKFVIPDPIYRRL